jgi:hypothetical protein
MPSLKQLRHHRPVWRQLALPLIFFLFLAGIATYIATAQTTYQIKLYPIADAYVNSQATDTNYGADPTVTLYQGDRFYIKFNFTATGITQNLPSLRYYLKLYMFGKNGGVSVYVYATTNEWSEDTITWNNKPAENSTTAIGSYTLPTPPAWVAIDLTDFITSNCMTKTCSFILTTSYITSSYTTGYYAKYYTKEYSDENYWPHFLIQYQALTTVTQNFTITETETITQTFTETVTETVTTTETVYDTQTITTVVTQPITVTETQTTYIPETTVTETVIVGNTTVTEWAEVTQTFTEFTTLTRTVTTTIPVYETVTEAVYQTMTETLAAREAETQAIDQVLALFMAMIPVIVVLVVLRGIMGAAR